MLVVNILQGKSCFVEWICPTLCKVKAEFKMNSALSKLFCFMHAEEATVARFLSSVLMK